MKKEIFGSLNDLYFDTVCPNISKYEDRLDKFKDNISTFDYVEIEDIKGDPNMVASFLLKYCLALWFDNFKLTASDLEVKFTRIFFSLFDINHKPYLSISTKTYIRLIECMDKIEKLLVDVSYLVPNVDFHIPFGTINRKSYRSLIDLIIIDKSNNVSLLIVGPKTDVVHSSKVHAALDYAKEAGLLVKDIYYLNYNYKYPDREIYLDRISVTNLISRVNSSFKKIKLQEVPNISFCSFCYYKDRCNMNDLVGK